MSWRIVILGIGALAIIAACVLSLVVGGWRWPTITVVMIVTWWTLVLVLPVGSGRSGRAPRP